MGNGLSLEQALVVAELECAALQLTNPGGAGALVGCVPEVLSAADQGLAAVAWDMLVKALVLRALGSRSTAQQRVTIRLAVQQFGRRVVSLIVRRVQGFAPAGRAEPLNWLEGLGKAGLADDPGFGVGIESAMPHQKLVLREKTVEVDELLTARFGVLTKENPTVSDLLNAVGS